jgi:cytochrome P450
MFDISSHNLFQLLQPKLLAELVALVSLAFTIRLFVHATQEASFAERQCCKPAKNRALIWDPFLGVDFIIESMQNARKSRYIKGSYERYRRFGSTYMMKSMFYQMIHTTDPENVKEVLATSFDKFKLTWIRVNAMEPLFGHGIFTSDGDRWSHARALLRPAFTRQNMTPMLDMMERHFQLLLTLLPKDDSTVDLQELLSSFSMDTATEFLLGHSVNSLNPEKKTKEDNQFYLDYIKCCLEAVRMIQLGPLQPFAFNLSAQRAKSRAFRYINRFVDEVLELKRSGKLESEDTQACGLAKYCFLRELAKNTDDRDMLRDQVLSVLLAGKDTTAGLMSNLFFELARHPDVYKKLRQEVTDHLGGCRPNTEDLKSMQYLRFVINEGRYPRFLFQFCS